MAIINGNLLRIKISGVSIGGTTDVSYSASKELQETTNQDTSGNITYNETTGKIVIKGSFGGFYDPDDTLNAEEIIDRLLNNSGLATVQVGNYISGIYYEFSALFSDVTIDAKNDSCPTVKGNFASSGTVTKLTSSAAAPELISGEAYDAHAIVLTFDSNMANPSSYSADFSVEADGNPITISTVILNNADHTQIIINTTDEMLSTNTITISIASGNIRSEEGGILATVTDFSITNTI